MSCACRLMQQVREHLLAEGFAPTGAVTSCHRGELWRRLPYTIGIHPVDEDGVELAIVVNEQVVRHEPHIDLAGVIGAVPGVD